MMRVLLQGSMLIPVTFSMAIKERNTGMKLEKLALGFFFLSAASSYQGGSPSVPTLSSGGGHQIQISGILMACDEDRFTNHNQFLVELWDEKKLAATLKVDEKGMYDSIHRSKIGNHSLRLSENS